MSILNQDKCNDVMEINFVTKEDEHGDEVLAAVSGFNLVGNRALIGLVSEIASQLKENLFEFKDREKGEYDRLNEDLCRVSGKMDRLYRDFLKIMYDEDI